MVTSRIPDSLSSSGAVCDAVLRLQGSQLSDELGRIVRVLLDSPHGAFVATADNVAAGEGADDMSAAGKAPHVREDIAFGGHGFGYYEASGRADYAGPARDELARLASLTGHLLYMLAPPPLAGEAVEAAGAPMEVFVGRHAEVLGQIDEAVLTLDLRGGIVSANQGALAMFGYSMVDVVGGHISMLMTDDAATLEEAGAAQGGRAIEVQCRKKSGDVSWASVSLGALSDVDQRMIGLIVFVRDISARKQTVQQLHEHTYSDPLTGLPNRTLFTKLVDQALRVAQRNSGAGCVLFIKVKRIEAAGAMLDQALSDAILQRLALRFRRALREEDILLRLEANVFVVGLFDIRQHFEATPVAQKLQAALGASFVIDEHAVRFGARIGISVFPHDAADGDSLLQLAESAMQRVSDDAVCDDQVAFHSREMNMGMHRRMRVEAGLRHALGHGELQLHYQPKFELGTARLIGAEALVRWLHPERGLVSAAEFIPLAETTGLIVQVGEWVLEAACAQAAIWQHAGLAPFRVSINVSGRELTANLPVRLANTLGRYRLDPRWIGLEIAGRNLMHETDNAIVILDQVHKLGVGLSIEDFGSAYLSLASLQRFPEMTLAIDRSFAAGLPGVASDCAIVSTIIGVGQRLNHKVIAKGVETLAQYEYLQRAGCGEVQGYLYSLPLPADQFEVALRDNWLLID